MNRDLFSNGAFMHLTELQPAPGLHHELDLAQATSATPSSYEITAGASSGASGAGEAGGGSGLPPGLHPSSLHHQHHEASRKRRISHFGDAYDAMSSCEDPRAASSGATMVAPSTRKRKTSSYGSASVYEDDSEDSRSTRTLPDKKQNHSEIEKRRRDKMNTYITELSSMVPMCGAMARKLDKLTVLRMAVTHLRSVRGALSVCPLTARPLPAFVSERELNQLILTAAKDAIVLVVGCDRGRLLYVSASVTNMLNYDKAELLGQSMFDILHPKDVAKVKEQLSSSDLSPRDRFIDAKTMLPVKADMGAGASRLCPGARRSFICRIKCKAPQQPPQPPPPPVKEEAEPAAKMRKKQHEKKYCVVQCTGYLKSWAPAEMSESGVGGGDGLEEDSCSLSCLVAVGRAVAERPPPARHPAPPTRPQEFLSRHNIDGKYIYVDQRVTLALGYLPQELLGTSLYEYVAGGELAGVARTHKAALLRREALPTPPYAARRKDGSHALMQTHFKPFRNPWTKDVECLVAKNTLVSEAQAPAAADAAYSDALQENGDMEVQRLIDSQVESHKIGSAIAEEVLRRSSTDFPSELPADLLHDVFNNQALVDNILCGDVPYQVRNNVPLSAAGALSPAAAAGGAGAAGDAAAAAAGEPGDADGDGAVSPMPLDGNGEAAMAVIMSLLEADAGLGGPVNFSGLPWPLP